MSSLDDRLEIVERQTAAMQKDLAVHLTECMGMHRAIELKLTSVGTSMEAVSQKLTSHIGQTESKLKRLERLIVLVGAVLMLTNILGTQETIRMLLSFVR